VGWARTARQVRPGANTHEAGAAFRGTAESRGTAWHEADAAFRGLAESRCTAWHEAGAAFRGPPHL